MDSSTFMYSGLTRDTMCNHRGDPTAEGKFVEVSEAYEALIDAESRKIYDQYGHEGLKQRQQ